MHNKIWFSERLEEETVVAKYVNLSATFWEFIRDRKIELTELQNRMKFMK